MKRLIIPLLIVGFILINLFNYNSKGITLDYCKEFCGYDNGRIPCGNCWADCMELNN